MKKLTFLAIVLTLLLGTYSCDLLTVSLEEQAYPTKYPSLDMAELVALNAEYKKENNGRLCSTLNEYGFTGFSEVLFEDGKNPCERVNRDVVRIGIDNTDTLLAAAKRVIVQNSKYTGVNDSSELVLEEMLPQPGCINCGRPDEYSADIEWKLTFENQLIDSTEVMDTEITVFIDAKGVNRIWGNWYPDLEVPDFVNFGYLEVQEGMVGWEIDMTEYYGEEFIYTVQEGDLTEIPQKVYLPIKSDSGNELEVRTCWAVSINTVNLNFPGWIAYIDIEEGFLVDLVSKQVEFQQKN
ncbi:MAG TPA: hypothetical protein VFM80_07675 [Gracilimonas sp.]|uniref:hypothetical protein n=1 Tax=Gracilimonas sp. TaxID=1974203 RepID=UPI002D8215DA|nr:hypothetical protein [Gracilimonas sp.]